MLKKKEDFLLNFGRFSAIISLLLILAKYVQRQSCRGRPPPTSPIGFGSNEVIVFAVVRWDMFIFLDSFEFSKLFSVNQVIEI